MTGMHRPSGKNRGGKDRGDGRSPGFRAPPPPATGFESKFYQDTVSAGTRVVLSLADGSTVRGVLKGFDRDQIMIERDSDSIVVRKSTIRYISEDS